MVIVICPVDLGLKSWLIKLKLLPNWDDPPSEWSFKNGSFCEKLFLKKIRNLDTIKWLDVKHQLDIKQNLDTQNRRMKTTYKA